ncbi:hypothetical protein C8J57DRAFT_1266265 [Mycena rebaudengoi]|nr:hypothetical protein C8J57DRAFT_1266265 [Mycena rebaudengoi]
MLSSVETSGCGDPIHAVPFYRSYKPAAVDHFYTTNVNIVTRAITGASYSLQGVAALVFVTQEESTVPFYRLAIDGPGVAPDNFYTISTTERDNALQNGYLNVSSDPFTFIYPTQVCESVPFYHLFHKTKTDNFYTTSESEGLDFLANQGYTDIGIAGYVLPVTSIQCAN